jgi:hypothetical protein
LLDIGPRAFKAYFKTTDSQRYNRLLGPISFQKYWP